jgi:Domain of unknown function (DUF4357)
MAGATIKIFLPTGEAESLRVAEISNWTGKALAAPRSELEQTLAREEMSQSGIYFLIGRDPDTDEPVAYIGEAEVVRDRIKQHRDKEYWVQLIIFVSKDENLTKAHIRYLEGRLIEDAIKAGRFEIRNGQSSGAKLPESDRNDMEVFLVYVRQLLPVLGCNVLVPMAQAEKKKPLICKIKGLVAYGNRSKNGFVVFKGSEAVLKPRKHAEEARDWTFLQREKLIKLKVLIPESDKFRFATDYEFSSPSAAAAAVRGGTASGLSEWRSEDGTSLKDLEAAAIAE